MCSSDLELKDRIVIPVCDQLEVVDIHAIEPWGYGSLEPKLFGKIHLLGETVEALLRERSLTVQKFRKVGAIHIETSCISAQGVARIHATTTLELLLKMAPEPLVDFGIRDRLFHREGQIPPHNAPRNEIVYILWTITCFDHTGNGNPSHKRRQAGRL